jgi:hypothetical protein
MARYVLRQGWCRDGNGAVIPNASVQIYIADSTTAPSAVYTAKTGGTAITDGVVTANDSGYFIVYIDDSAYPLGSEFDVVISKPSFNSTTLPDVRG